MQLAGSLLRSFEVKLLLFFCSTPGRHKTRDVTLDLADVVAFNDYPGAVEEFWLPNINMQDVYGSKLRTFTKNCGGNKCTRPHVAT